ncbi:MAG TPA: SusC/RagA family TonB-linked outer membrane protein [Gemmatimonadaceae bacterium]|nr:SusC/RagA family TonB-linked outer membrane protein [Gemmatimonadaceae bacterium]
MGNIRWRLIAVVALAVGAPLRAQGDGHRRITGHVIDAATRAPIPAVSVLVPGGTIGTSTTDSGSFSLRVPAGTRSLAARRIGYHERAILLAADVTDYTVELTKDVLELETQVVTGVATSISSKNAATYDPTVTADQLVGAPAPTLENALQGKVPGALIQANSGAPGGGLQVQVRGVSSINVNAQPLYVIDGIIADNDTYNSGLTSVSGAAASLGTSNQDQSPNRIADINPADIESIQVLEGAAASSIYGDKAAAGVIVITTKKGRPGAPQFAATQRFGTFNLANEIDVRHYSLAEAYAGGAAVGLDSTAVRANYDACHGFCDFQKQLYGGGELSYETDVNVRGGSNTATYYVSGLTKYDNGAQINTGYNKQAIRANVSTTLSSTVSASVTLAYTSSLTRVGVNGNDNYGIAGYDIISYTPSWFDMAAHNPDGSYVTNPFGTANALADAHEIRTPDEVNRFTGGLNVTYKALSTRGNALEAVFQGGADVVNERTEFYAPPDLQVERVAAPVPGVATYLSPYGRLINYSISLVHTWTGLSWMTATSSIGYTRDKHLSYQPFAGGAGIAPSAPSVPYALDHSVQLAQQEVDNSGFYGQEQLQLLDQRLTITGGVNAERSTNNGTVNAFYPFPKASISYRFAHVTGWLDELKPRLAFGQSGNTPTFGIRYTQNRQTLFGGHAGVTYGDTLGDPTVRPETSTDIETGFDASFWKGRAALSATVYQKRISNLLLLAGAPPATGADVRWINGGQFTNAGIELSLDAQPVAAGPFSWTTQTTYSRNYSRVDRLPTAPFSSGNFFGYGQGGFYVERGNSITAIWGYKTAGGSLVPVGNAAPAFTMGFANNLGYGPLHLRGFFEWNYGQSVIDGTFVYFDDFGNLQDTAATRRRLTAYNNGLTAYTQPASYLKLRELTLSYDVPATAVRALGRGWIRTAQLSVSGRNLVTWTRYPGLDPEVSNFGAQQIGRSDDVTPYPPTRSYFVSLDLGF